MKFGSLGGRVVGLDWAGGGVQGRPASADGWAGVRGAGVVAPAVAGRLRAGVFGTACTGAEPVVRAPDVAPGVEVEGPGPPPAAADVVADAGVGGGDCDGRGAWEGVEGDGRSRSRSICVPRTVAATTTRRAARTVTSGARRQAARRSLPARRGGPDVLVTRAVAGAVRPGAAAGIEVPGGWAAAVLSRRPLFGAVCRTISGFFAVSRPLAASSGAGTRGLAETLSGTARGHLPCRCPGRAVLRGWAMYRGRALQSGWAVGPGGPV